MPCYAIFLNKASIGSFLIIIPAPSVNFTELSELCFAMLCNVVFFQMVFTGRFSVIISEFQRIHDAWTNNIMHPNKGHSSNMYDD